ncbi:MAG: hypothetical protein ACOYON_02215 [Fimbriimonas sp.]
MLGINLQLLIGPGVPLPASPAMMEALQECEVHHTDDLEARSGFKLVFRDGRSGPQDTIDSPLVADPRLGALSRVVLVAYFGLRPVVLMDGVVLEQRLQPGDRGTGSTLTLLGEDISVMMDFEEKVAEHTAMPRFATVGLILAGYAQYGITPMPLPSASDSIRLPTDGTNVQNMTDLAYIRTMARACGHVFYIDPGPLPMMSIGYFGPRQVMSLPQNPINVNMGPSSNARRFSVGYNAQRATSVSGDILDRMSGQKVPVRDIPVSTLPMASRPAALTQTTIVRSRLRDTQGMTIAEAMASANAQARASSEVVQADGELDSIRYGGILKARGTVWVRGAGATHDGLYYVKSVSHSIKRGEYTQGFSLQREGTGTTTPIVPPAI